MAASREDRAYSEAVRLFHDKFYAGAEAKLTQYLQTYRKSTNAPNAVLLLAQSEFYLKNYTAAANRLADPASLDRAKVAGLVDRYDYWRAEAQFAAGDTDGAARTFAAVAENFPESPLALKAVVEAAAAFGRNSNWAPVDGLLDNPNGLFQQRARVETTNEQVVAGRLIQAESKCAQRDFAWAAQVLGLVNTATLTPEQAWRRNHLLYRAELGGKDLEGALLAATNLLQIARAEPVNLWATNLAESVACHAEALEELGRLAEAAAAWQENFGTNLPADQQRRAILKVADLALAQRNLDEAGAQLESFLTNYPTSAAAPAARLGLGELHLEKFIRQPLATDELAQAESSFNEVISAEGATALAGKAYMDQGWCTWLQATNAAEAGDTNVARQKFDESLDDFKSAAGRLPRGSEEAAVATFKMADAKFALGDYAGASEGYRAVLADYGGMTNVAAALGGRALYQILRAQLELRDTNGLDAIMSQLLEKFSGSETSDEGWLLVGQGFSDFGDPGKARALFERFERDRGDSKLMPQVAFALARTYERERKWPETITNCEAWLQSYPTNVLRPQVEYVRDRAVAQSGDEARAFSLFSDFVAENPTNAALTPLARLCLGDTYFRRGTNFLDAEKQYELIYQIFPASPLAGQAQLMAARAAMGRLEFAQAKANYLTPLINNTNAPGSLRDKARFAYSEASVRMTSDTNTASLQDATNVLAQMYAETPTNIVGALAWCETGTCDYQLGAYDAATNAFAQVLAAPTASVELRCRAKVGLGMTLEKKAEGLAPDAQRALRTLALENYTDVIYTQEATDSFWMKKAAWQALPLIPLVDGDVNAFIDRLEHWLPQLTDQLEKKRAALGKH